MFKNTGAESEFLPEKGGGLLFLNDFTKLWTEEPPSPDPRIKTILSVL